MKKQSKFNGSKARLVTHSLALSAALVSALTLGSAASAQSTVGLDPASQEALDKTKALLNDRAQVDAYSKTNKEAAQADQNMKALFGNNAADTSEAYQLSSQIFETLTKQTNGDPQAMQKILTEAMKNPAGFAQMLTPEQKAQLSGLAKKAEGVKPSASKP